MLTSSVRLFRPCSRTTRKLITYYQPQPSLSCPGAFVGNIVQFSSLVNTVENSNKEDDDEVLEKQQHPINFSFSTPEQQSDVKCETETVSKELHHLTQLGDDTDAEQVSIKKDPLTTTAGNVANSIVPPDIIWDDQKHTSPKAELIAFYRKKRVQCSFGKDDWDGFLERDSKKKDGLQFWTVRFTCPISSKKFSTQAFGSADHYHVDAEDGKVWFRTVKKAEHSVARVVLEYWKNRRNLDPQNFDEYMKKKNPGPLEDAINVNRDSSPDFLVSPLCKPYDMASINTEYTNLLEEPINNSHLDANKDSTTMEEPSYTIQHIPSLLFPMEKMVQAWCSDETSHTTATNQFHPKTTSSNTIWNANHALAWLQKLRDSNVVISTASYNSILSALAATPFEWSYDSQKGNNHSENPHHSELSIHVPLDVERIASKLLGEMSECDTHTYNLFLKCLRRNSQLETTIAAEKFFNDKMSDKQLVNSETLNILMSLWSKCPSECKVKSKEIFDSFEGFGIRPNRESYELVLRSVARSEDTLDMSLALEYIQHMEKNGINVDLSTYNALMPCSDDANSFHTTSTSEILDEASSARLYNQAVMLEKWFHHIEQNSSFSPDMHTYQSVIQAWIETQSMEGLVRAEEWAMRLLKKEPSFQVSQDTFLPIISTWARKGNKNGPSRVQEWIQQLEDMSSDVPQVKPDLKMKSMVIVAWLQYQRKLISSHEKNVILEAGDHQELLEQCAIKSSNLMQEFFSVYDHDSTILTAVASKDLFSMLFYVLEAWENVPIPDNNATLNSQAKLTTKTESIFNVIHIATSGPLQKVVFSPYDSELPAEFMDDFKKSLVTVYSRALNTLGTCPKTKKTNLFRTNFQMLESMLYLSDHMFDESPVLDTNNSMPKMTQHHLKLYEEILQACTSISQTQKSRKGDAVRILTAILNRIQPQPHSRNYNYNKTYSSRPDDTDHNLNYTGVYMEMIARISEVVKDDADCQAKLFKRVYRHLIAHAASSRNVIDVEVCVGKMRSSGVHKELIRKFMLPLRVGSGRMMRRKVASARGGGEKKKFAMGS